MNICYLIHSLSNRAGTESHVYHMSMLMAELGHRVHILSLTGNGEWDFQAFGENISVHQFDLQNGFWGSSRHWGNIFPLSIWRYGIQLRRMLPAIVETHSIDIIESTDWGMDAWAYLPIRKVPVCVRLHGYPGFKSDFENHRLMKWPKNQMVWRLQRKHILNADLVTGVSEAYTAFVRQAWRIPKKSIPIIPIAVNTDVFRPADTPRDDHSILFVGRLEELKGMETLARAIPMVLKQFPSTKIHFAGVDFPLAGSHQTWSQYFIQQYGPDRIVYLGSLPTKDLVRYFQRSTICVIPSLYEPGGTVAFEAMACGCPVVASRAGGLAEAIRDRQTGFLVPPGDATALANGLVELLGNERLRRELSLNALAAVVRDYDIKSVLQQTLALYNHTIFSFKKARGRISSSAGMVP